jgi:hypothetical protein
MQPAAEPNPLAYYNPEERLFPNVAQQFGETTGELNSAALYLILDWKSPRARTRHLKRLAGNKAAGSFAAAARAISVSIKEAAGPEQRLEILMRKWGFRLPTASAILSVLYPEEFTIFDWRVCDELHDFHQLGGLNWSVKTWPKYQQFVAAVRKTAVRDGARPDSSLRDCDRWLWGQNKQNAMLEEVASADKEAAARRLKLAPAATGRPRTA